MSPIAHTQSIQIIYDLVQNHLRDAQPTAQPPPAASTLFAPTGTLGEAVSPSTTSSSYPHDLSINTNAQPSPYLFLVLLTVLPFVLGVYALRRYCHRHDYPYNVDSNHENALRAEQNDIFSPVIETRHRWTKYLPSLRLRGRSRVLPKVLAHSAAVNLTSPRPSSMNASPLVLGSPVLSQSSPPSSPIIRTPPPAYPSSLQYPPGVPLAPPTPILVGSLLGCYVKVDDDIDSVGHDPFAASFPLCNTARRRDKERWRNVGLFSDGSLFIH